MFFVWFFFDCFCLINLQTSKNYSTARLHTDRTTGVLPKGPATPKDGEEEEEEKHTPLDCLEGGLLVMLGGRGLP